MICFSSEAYKIDPSDLVILQDADIDTAVKDEVLILIGNDKDGTRDKLIKGRDVIERAIADGTAYIPCRIAFVSRTKRFDFISPIIKKLRYKFKAYSSNIYHMDPLDIRNMKIERGLRTKENAYTFSSPKYKMNDVERDKTYNDLRDSLQKGYDDRYPLDIMLCRNFGIQDTLNQGHHRMSVAIEIGLKRVAVHFCAAGQAPKVFQPLFKFIARTNLHLRRLLGV